MDASFVRLRARGAFIVTSSYSSAIRAVGVTTIASEAGSYCWVRKPASWSKSRLKIVETVASIDSSSSSSSHGEGDDTDTEEGVVPIEWQNGNAFFGFNTAAGKIYTLIGA